MGVHNTSLLLCKLGNFHNKQDMLIVKIKTYIKYTEENKITTQTRYLEKYHQ